jgi:hypothetical protein
MKFIQMKTSSKQACETAQNQTGKQLKTAQNQLFISDLSMTLGED